jgi:nicotinate-nucleotide--dimethylbenzimidazole phosphoribosyltransferase
MHATGDLGALLAEVRPVDAAVAAEARAELDRKTKPRSSLGRLEDLAAQVASVRGTSAPGPFRPVVVVAAGDHGVAVEGVSAYPPEVTRQMVATFASGGAAICVLARAADAGLVVIDAGIREPFDHPGVRNERLGPGTANAASGPAMSRGHAEQALARGAAVAAELTSAGATLVALGEMGIGNSTAAAAVVSALLGSQPAEVCGPGTGLDGPGVEHKVSVVRRMLEVNRPDPRDPVGVLAAVGGFEIALLGGVALGAARARAVVVLDGFITAAAALAAVRLAPDLAGYLVASHLSPEPGHRVVLDALGAVPLLELGLRLGEGTGAAVALPLVECARRILVEMATFEDAGVTDTGR